jgi:hypothetical protein
MDTVKVYHVALFIYRSWCNWAGVSLMEGVSYAARWDHWYFMKLGFPRDSLVHRGLYLWQMDHIIPVTEGGGGDCGLNNLRTLCVPCHKRVSKENAARQAKRRKRERLRRA